LGLYTEHFCAQVLPPIDPSVTGALRVTSGDQVQIAQPTSFTTYTGLPFSATIYATGTPTPKLTFQYGPGDPKFQVFTFTDNGNGTATITAPASAMMRDFGLIAQACQPQCATITASNGIPGFAATQFSATTVPAPAPAFSIPLIPVFEAGVPTSFTISMTEQAAGPLLYAYPSGTLVLPAEWEPSMTANGTTTPLSSAPWLSFTDNGNGTATFSGTAPFGTVSALALEVAGYAMYTDVSTANITIPVRSDPIFTSASTAIFNVGTSGVFDVTASSGSIALNQPAVTPNGLTINSGVIAGTAQTASGGHYPLQFSAANGYGTTIQPFDLFVTEAPTIYAATPGNAASFAIHTGRSTSVQIPAATDYPKTPPPSGAPSSLGNGLTFNLSTSMPSNAYSFNYKDASGDPAGVGTFTFNPPASAIGSYSVSLDAGNGFAPDGTLNLTVKIVQGGDVNEDGVVNCADLTIVENAFGKNQSQPGYDIRADINLDGVVNIKDLSFVASKTPAGTVCH
jgi:hypothetical protein